MIQHVVEQVMEFDVENLCNAAYGQRSAERANRRNGYRERLWETRAGAVNVRIPKLRSGSYFPPFLEPRRTAEKALAAVIQEAYVQGVSTRSVDERVNAFLDRPREGDWPYLWIDATYVKCREAGRIVSKAVIIAVAVNTEGQREVLGMAAGP
jgi:putative transposase